MKRLYINGIYQPVGPKELWNLFIRKHELETYTGDIGYTLGVL